MSQITAQRAQGVELDVLLDGFDDDRKAGHVVGSRSSSGAQRGGVDVEGVLSIDHGALRIAPTLDPEWGRAQLAYGPYARRAGLTFATVLLNGHNTSQWEKLPEPMSTRLLRWWQGHGDRRWGLVRRLAQWLRYPRKRYMIRRLRTWRRMATSDRVEAVNENLAVGWFASEGQSDPVAGGNQFVMHAALGDNGELWAKTSSQMHPAVRGVQNVPICYLVVLRDRGAAYYTSSVPGAYGTDTFPNFRPLAIDPSADDPVVFAGIDQRALGQIGFRVDSRVYGVQIEHVPSLEAWYGTAHAADALAGGGSLESQMADIGGSWTAVEGRFERTAHGCRALEGPSMAVLQPAQRSGLAHVVFEFGTETDGCAGIVWRFEDATSFLRFEIGRWGCRLVHHQAGTTRELASSTMAVPSAPGRTSVQVVDHNGVMTVAVDGVTALAGIPTDRLPTGFGVGMYASGTSGAVISSFEAHPASVDLSSIIRLSMPSVDLVPDTVEDPSDIEVYDDFAGSEGVDLDGRPTTRGNHTWRREYGHGRIVTDGLQGAVVDASVERPNPGSTAYTIDWHDQSFANLAVDITPPGTAIGHGESGRGGLILWQDRRNFLTITMFVDDSYDGASIAIFSHLDGFEELYDAVWSMVGKRMYWGVAHRLGVVFDGMHLMVLINGEPVLYRALTDLYADRSPLRVSRVGMAVNWEWGDDTGSRFGNFAASARQPAR